MIGLTLKHLRYLDALARHGHFGRAAEVCNVTQPALSQQIKELERILGAHLVERGARRTRLTALGEDVLERARGILRAVEDLEDIARASGGPLSGKLRLGVIPTVAPYLLPRIVCALSERLPDLELELRETATNVLIEQLLDSELDVALLALPTSEPAVREFALFEERFVLVRPKADSGKPVPGPDKLRQMRLLLLEEGHCFRDQALSYCKMGRAPAHQVMEGSSLSTLVQMVGAGLGVTLIPEMAVAMETRSADVSFARLPPPGPSRTLGLVWRKSSPLAVQLMQIGAIIRSLPGDSDS